jgi:hypothetical protein
MGGGFIQITQESGPPRENHGTGNMRQKSRNGKVKFLKAKIPCLILYDDDADAAVDEDDYYYYYYYLLNNNNNNNIL